MVGSFSNQKNQLFLIELIKDLPENFTLHLAGIGPNLNHCKQYVEEKKLDERVFFYGLIKDIPRFYSTLDLYILSIDCVINDGYCNNFKVFPVGAVSNIIVE